MALYNHATFSACKSEILNELKLNGVWYANEDNKIAKFSTIVCITGETSKKDEVLEFILNPDKHLSKCAIFVTNSAITNAGNLLYSYFIHKGELE